ncbi:hypothetical protein ABZ725_48835 [Streptomyces sp. NPDC006872]|uniref:hypothetical protein n=1 Tax=Streptomyces sp. NPDC006872 TaxID=3155720 RepID=UPI0033CBB5C9
MLAGHGGGLDRVGVAGQLGVNVRGDESSVVEGRQYASARESESRDVGVDLTGSRCAVEGEDPVDESAAARHLAIGPTDDEVPVAQQRHGGLAMEGLAGVDGDLAALLPAVGAEPLGADALLRAAARPGDQAAAVDRSGDRRRPRGIDGAGADLHRRSDRLRVDDPSQDDVRSPEGLVGRRLLDPDHKGLHSSGVREGPPSLRVVGR